MQDSNLHIPKEWRFSRPLLYQLRQSSDSMSGFANWPLSLFGKYVNIIWCVTDTNTFQSSVGFTFSPFYLTMDLPWIPPLLHVCTKWPTLIVFERNRRLELPRRPWKGRMLPLHQFRVTRPFTMYDYSQSNIFRCALVKYSLMFLM